MTKAEKQAAEYAAETDKPKTVRVRIAVAIGENGAYHSAGWSRAPKEHNDREVMNMAHEHLNDVPVVSCWVEADIPLPQLPQTVRGEVVV